jgi:BirA family biotin operon repressor/biotin-[acetyl-CoA-carboxylase] ligase
LYFSIILPKSNVDNLQTLTIMAAVAVAQIIKNSLGVEPFIKLPNDVYLNGKKVCGIMTENVVGADVKLSVMGIGLNTNIKEMPADLRAKTTSLELELGKAIDNKAILGQIITQLKAILKSISS